METTSFCYILKGKRFLLAFKNQRVFSQM